MARFHARIQGNRGGEATRLGSAQSGLQAYVNGWDVGVRVEASARGDTDLIDITITGGSNSSYPMIYVGQARRSPDGAIEFVPGHEVKA